MNSDLELYKSNKKRMISFIGGISKSPDNKSIIRKLSKELLGIIHDYVYTYNNIIGKAMIPSSCILTCSKKYSLIQDILFFEIINGSFWSDLVSGSKLYINSKIIIEILNIINKCCKVKLDSSYYSNSRVKFTTIVDIVLLVLIRKGWRNFYKKILKYLISIDYDIKHIINIYISRDIIVGNISPRYPIVLDSFPIKKGKKYTATKIAIFQDTIRAILPKLTKEHFDIHDGCQYTLLHALACYPYSFKCFKLLDKIATSINFDHLDTQGRNALYFACKYSDLETVKYLIKKTSESLHNKYILNYSDENIYNIYTAAIMYNPRQNVAKYLFAEFNGKNNTSVESIAASVEYLYEKNYRWSGIKKKFNMLYECCPVDQLANVFLLFKDKNNSTNYTDYMNSMLFKAIEWLFAKQENLKLDYLQIVQLYVWRSYNKNISEKLNNKLLFHNIFSKMDNFKLLKIVVGFIEKRICDFNLINQFIEKYNIKLDKTISIFNQLEFKKEIVFSLININPNFLQLNFTCNECKNVDNKLCKTCIKTMTCSSDHCILPYDECLKHSLFFFTKFFNIDLKQINIECNLFQKVGCLNEVSNILVDYGLYPEKFVFKPPKKKWKCISDWETKSIKSYEQKYRTKEKFKLVLKLLKK
jgi:hypothetical protein